MAHIVINGAGIGGMPAAYEMVEMLPEEHRITVVNTTDYFQFVPSKSWVGVGWRKREEVTLPIAPYLTRKKIGFIPKAVETIDVAANKLTLVDGQTLDYDHRVIATGPQLAFDDVPGAGPVASGAGGFTHSICHVDHARRLCGDAAGGGHASAYRLPENGLHDRKHDDCHLSHHCQRTRWQASHWQGHLERGLLGRHGRHRRRLCGLAANSATQCELV